VATASGSAALSLAMLAFEVGPGDEVVTVGNTYAATVSSIRLTGATPVLVDVNRDTYRWTPSGCARR
jgi:dTDP-4-amino-4,6-dideoxygalactose transaminase